MAAYCPVVANLDSAIFLAIDCVVVGLRCGASLEWMAVLRRIVAATAVVGVAARTEGIDRCSVPTMTFATVDAPLKYHTALATTPFCLRSRFDLFGLTLKKSAFQFRCLKNSTLALVRRHYKPRADKRREGKFQMKKKQAEWFITYQRAMPVDGHRKMAECCCRAVCRWHWLRHRDALLTDAIAIDRRSRLRQMTPLPPPVRPRALATNRSHTAIVPPE